MSNILRNLLAVAKHAYAPNGFKKVHSVALIYGVVIGGFVAGTTAAGSTDGPMWPLTAGCAVIGAIIGAFIAIGLVNNSTKKQ